MRKVFHILFLFWFCFSQPIIPGANEFLHAIYKSQKKIFTKHGIISARSLHNLRLKSFTEEEIEMMSNQDTVWVYTDVSYENNDVSELIFCSRGSIGYHFDFGDAYPLVLPHEKIEKGYGPLMTDIINNGGDHIKWVDGGSTADIIVIQRFVWSGRKYLVETRTIDAVCFSVQ